MNPLLESETSSFKSTGNWSIYLGSFDLVLLQKNADVGINSFKQLYVWPNVDLCGRRTAWHNKFLEKTTGWMNLKGVVFAEFIPFLLIFRQQNLGFLTFRTSNCGRTIHNGVTWTMLRWFLSWSLWSHRMTCSQGFPPRNRRPSPLIKTTSQRWISKSMKVNGLWPRTGVYSWW